MSSRMGRMLVWLSGANEDILRNVPGERTKMIGVGGAVLTTAVMAALSFTLTLAVFVHVPVYFAAIVGILWGLAILNLDRWLVASIKRQDAVFKTVIVIMPRFMLAMIIGFVISEPLVLSVFDTEVTTQAIKDNQIEFAERSKELDKEFARIDKLREEKAELEATVANVGTGSVLTTNPRYVALTEELTALQNQLLLIQADIAQSRTGSTGYQQKIALRDDLQTRVDAKQAEQDALKAQLLTEEGPIVEQQRASQQEDIKQLDEEITRLEEQKTTEEEAFTDTGDTSIGLLDRMEALQTLSAEHETINIAQWVLRLFILSIDVLPILVKLLMSLGTPSLYDLELENYEEFISTRNNKRKDSALAALEAKHQEANDPTAWVYFPPAIEEEEEQKQIETPAPKEIEGPKEEEEEEEEERRYLSPRPKEELDEIVSEEKEVEVVEPEEEEITHKTDEDILLGVAEILHDLYDHEQIEEVTESEIVVEAEEEKEEPPPPSPPPLVPRDSPNRPPEDPPHVRINIDE